MDWSLLTQIFICWIYVSTVLHMKTNGKISTHSVKERKTSNGDLMPVQRLQRHTPSSFNKHMNQTPSVIKQSNKSLETEWTEGRSSTNDSVITTASDNKSSCEKKLSTLERQGWTLPLNVSEKCEYNYTHKTLEHPCFYYTGSMNIDYMCGMACSEAGEKRNCGITRCSGRYLCRLGTYIPLSKLCDGIKDCNYYDDEEYCMNSTYLCSCTGITVDCNQTPPENFLPFRTEQNYMSMSMLSDFSNRHLLYLVIMHCSWEQLTSVMKMCQHGGCSELGYLTVLDIDLSGKISELIKLTSVMGDLLVIRLSDIKVSSFSVGVFDGLQSKVLDLTSNGISSVSVDVFKGLQLQKLNLSSNRISSLPVGVFNGLPLQQILLSLNRLYTVAEGLFRGLPLEILDLSSNKISKLPVGVFNGLPLTRLDLSSNRISTLPVDIFNGLPLETLNLSENIISTLPVGVFNKLPLMYLSLSSNRISSLPAGVFHDLPLKIMLFLALNRISTLPVGVFTGLQLSHLYLSSNKISAPPRGVFNGLSLRVFFLSSNRISARSLGNILNNLTVQILDLSSNKVAFLHRGMFRGLRCNYLDLSNNGMMYIQDRSFENIMWLKFLVLNKNNLEVSEGMFKGIHNLTHLIIDSYMLCCVKPKTVPYVNCLATVDGDRCVDFDVDRTDRLHGLLTCSAPTTAISTCTSIIGSSVLRVFLWMIGLTALVGNTGVIVYRLLSDKENLQKSYSVFVMNLSVSDILMGLYLLIISSADIRYRGVYAWNDQKWRRSTLCVAAGIISTISSEMSTFAILLITIDRFIVIVFPFTQHKMTWKQAIRVSIILWLVSIILAVLPQLTFHTYFKNGFYSTSGVCLALPLTDNTDGVEYSMFVFVGLNSVIFLFIMVVHIWIYKSISSSSSAIANSKRRRRDISVAKTLFLVVATDFCCWIPIGVMGVLAQAGIQTPDDIYSWVMIFVLPINSAINPFIYTFIYECRNRRVQRRTQNTEMKTSPPWRQTNICTTFV